MLPKHDIRLCIYIYINGEFFRAMNEKFNSNKKARYK